MKELPVRRPPFSVSGVVRYQRILNDGFDLESSANWTTTDIRSTGFEIMFEILFHSVLEREIEHIIIERYNFLLVPNPADGPLQKFESGEHDK
jgi:hypothetical protein